MYINVSSKSFSRLNLMPSFKNVCLCHSLKRIASVSLLRLAVCCSADCTRSSVRTHNTCRNFVSMLASRTSSSNEFPVTIGCSNAKQSFSFAMLASFFSHISSPSNVYKHDHYLHDDQTCHTSRHPIDQRAI